MVLKLYQKLSLVAVVLALIEIFYVSSITFGPGVARISWIPIVYHFSIFFSLGFFIYVFSDFNYKYLILIFAICFAYAGLDELHQFFVPGRCSALDDWLVDVAGVIWGSLVGEGVRRVFGK